VRGFAGITHSDPQRHCVMASVGCIVGAVICRSPYGQRTSPPPTGPVNSHAEPWLVALLRDLSSLRLHPSGGIQ